MSDNDGDILTVIITLMPIVCLVISSFIDDLRNGNALDM